MPSAADASQGQRRNPARLALRVAAGAAVLLLVVWYADPAALWAGLRRADLRWFALAVLVSIASNVFSALRWAVIARGLSLTAPTGRLILMYFRGMTSNMLLPGATLSGDLLRSVQLSRLGNAFLASALSVFLDRFSGLWVLCLLSLLAAIGVGLWGEFAGVAVVPPERLLLYIAILTGIAAAPFVPLPLGRLEQSSIGWIAALASKWEQLRGRLRQAQPALIASTWQSLCVQFLSAGALWICGLSVGLTLSYGVMLAAAAPIFIMAALPIGFAGFGTRELAAVVILGFVGVPGDQATATAMLYGIAAVVQGMLAAPLFFSKT